jgi:hypothetical protein
MSQLLTIVDVAGDETLKVTQKQLRKGLEIFGELGSPSGTHLAFSSLDCTSETPWLKELLLTQVACCGQRRVLHTRVLHTMA